MQGTLPLIYILGTQRGGTTVASSLLTAIPGTAFIGETLRISAPFEERFCGCGSVPTNCPVWSQLLADGTIDSRARREFAELGSEALGTGAEKAKSEYGARMIQLYRRYAQATRATVVIDGSKDPDLGRLVAALDGLNVHFIHVVRDPRGVVRSVVKRTNGGWLEKRVVAVKTALWYLLRQRRCRALLGSSLGRSVTTVRYEDLVRHPSAFIASVSKHLGIRMAEADEMSLPTSHSLRRRDRPRRPTLPLVEDRSWVRDLGFTDMLVTTLVTLPYIRRFGYPARRPRDDR